MKKIILAIFCLLPFVAQAVEPEKYLKGAVPEVDGVVVFSQTYDVSHLSQDEAMKRALEYVQTKVMAPAIQLRYTRMLTDGVVDGQFVARVEEYMVFRKAFFNLDRTRIRYQLTATYASGKVKVDISQITYYYNEDQEGKNGIHYKAEEWINDKNAVNKKGTKLYPRSGKFRRKTIDRVDAIFNELGLILNQR